MKNHKQQAGFTLIELMITVVVIGILAAIVVPNYSDYVRRSALQEAFANLSDMRVRLEQFYQSNRNYGTGDCANDGTASRMNFNVGGKFTYRCELTGVAPAKPEDAYRLTATGNSGGATGHVFTLDSNNAKKTTSFKGSAVNKACWLVKGSEC